MWTDELCDYVKTRWADGASAQEISVGAYERFRAVKTRNAILGWLHRQGLSRIDCGGSNAAQRVARARASQRAKRQAVLSRAQREMFSPARPKPVEPRAAFVELEPTCTLIAAGDRQCRWMPGDPKVCSDVCGRETAEGATYCAHHAALAYAPEVKRKSPDNLTRLARYLDALGQYPAGASL